MPDRDPAYEVEAYSPDRLIQILVSKSDASKARVKNKTHLSYLDGYFQKLDAKTILIENDYFDRDYLEDYAAYYARCFHQYERRCTRLHFFTTQFDRERFSALLRAEKGAISVKELRESYLGFMVVRPLPSTIIGRTCLKTYPEEERRSFPTTREYEANLFGISLPVDSLAFQEQDQAVAACATSALWSAFHKTGLLFQHPIPSPVEITQAANERFPLASRGIPSKGLTVEQMAGAIRAVGLEPFLIDVSDITIFKKIIYAYASAHIPVLLLFKLYCVHDPKPPDDPKPPEYIGLHAVTVAGFSIPAQHSENTSIWRCERMDKIYVHDDQVGPFARMELDGKNLVVEDQDVFSLGSAWSPKHRAVPTFALAPLYHKIRLPIDDPLKDITVLADFLGGVASLLPHEPTLKGFEFDLRLSSLNDFRADCIKCGQIKGKPLEEIVCESNPRFIWRVTLRQNGVPCMDFLYDATDIQQGLFFLRGVEYNAQIRPFLKTLVDYPPFRPFLAERTTQSIEFIRSEGDNPS
jgi:hypothetical protein